MNVLSLFDGMSCGRIALERAGIQVDKYFASEVDKHAIAVAKANWPETKHIGDVREIKVNANSKLKIDLLIGGSPCQSFSFAGKRKGMATKCETEILTLEQYLELKEQNFEFEGQSYLFWEYMRLLHELKPKYFLLENVKMAKKWKDILSEAIGCEPIEINSNLVSAQNRKRLYWTNIPNVDQPEDLKIFLKDILQKDVDESFYLSSKATDYMSRERNGKPRWEYHTNPPEGKAACLTACMGKGVPYGVITPELPIGCDYRSDEGFRFRDNGKTGTSAARARNDESCGQLVSQYPRIRRLTPIECERLQTVPDNYTNCVANTQRYKMLGNGWTIDVIAHIFKGLK